MKRLLHTIIHKSELIIRKSIINTEGKKAIDAFESWIEEGGHLTPKVTLNETAHAIGLTAHELRQLCTKHYGCSFSNKIKTLRIEEACRIMRSNPDMPISTLGTMIGIEDRSNFRKEFKSVLGVYPQEWKDNLK